MKIPFHVNFEEVNLRYYVKRIEGEKTKRGVGFIKEIVPKMAITTVANIVYKENYETLKMDHEWREEGGYLHITYKWRKKGRWNSVYIKAKTNPGSFPEGSETEFITEHYWGYAQINPSKTNEYEVTHPRWEAYEVVDFELDVDFGTVYGNDFAFINALEPTSVMLAEGSEITVENKRKLPN